MPSLLLQVAFSFRQFFFLPLPVHDIFSGSRLIASGGLPARHCMVFRSLVVVLLLLAPQHVAVSGFHLELVLVQFQALVVFLGLGHSHHMDRSF